MIGVAQHTLRIFSAETIGDNFRKIPATSTTSTVSGSIQPDPNARYKISMNENYRGRNIEDFKVFYCYTKLNLVINEDNPPQIYYEGAWYNIMSIAHYDESARLSHVQCGLVKVLVSR